MYGHENPTMRSTDAGEIVGPRMHRAVEAAERRAWQSRKALAEAVGPNGSTDYGYRIVNRCIRKGLISRPDPDHDKAHPYGQGAVYITAKGEDYLHRVRAGESV